MLSIAICDDQQDSLETIEEELHRSSKNLNVEIETHLYTDGNDMLELMKNNKGGMKEMTLKEKLDKKPESVIELAVKGMLPKGPLGRAMIKKLFVYAGPEHPHAAQKPEELTF